MCVRTSWFSESLSRKERITAVTLTWTQASGWVCVHRLCHPRAGELMTTTCLTQAFTGSGNRLDGKTKGIEPSPAPLGPSDIKRWADFLQCRNKIVIQINIWMQCFNEKLCYLLLIQHIADWSTVSWYEWFNYCSVFMSYYSRNYR